MYYSGTSGLVLPVANKLQYPRAFTDKPRLTYYASLFNSIEVNSTFYKIPKSATVLRWAEEVPGHFRFTFKLWRGITHVKQLNYSPTDLTQFMEVINEAGIKKGCLLVQFPPGLTIEFKRQLYRLINQIRELDSGHTWLVALEFRHPSWYNYEVWQFIRQNNMGIVIQDIPKSATPFEYADAPFVYLRFHGPDGKYRGSYANEILNEYAGYIHQWLLSGKKVFVYFNNTIGDAVKNLATLNSLVNENL
ncbi:MAG: DUF72 domain-containing protein [Mucilaginibacter sp.]